MYSWQCIPVAACTLLVGSAASSQPAPSKLPHACDILTVEDAEHVLGEGAHLNHYKGSCYIEPKDNKFRTVGVIVASIRYAGNLYWSMKRLSMLASGLRSRTASDGITPTSISGLGDDAYILSGYSDSLHIINGHATVTVTGERTEFAKREEALRYIGGKLLAGMERQ
jgi:hypothetical protein